MDILSIHSYCPTHSESNTLGLFFCLCSPCNCSNTPFSFCGHNLISYTLSLFSTSYPSTSNQQLVTSRNLCHLTLWISILLFTTCGTKSHPVLTWTFISTTAQLLSSLNTLAPLITNRIRSQPLQPWQADDMGSLLNEFSVKLNPCNISPCINLPS